jgi:anti-sigma regulatory factor (Ser/Thr protein kinase)
MAGMALPIDERSVATARRLLLAALDEREDPAVDDAVLVISELVTNAVRHTRTVLFVLVTIENHTLHVDVTDDDPTLPVPPDPEHDATNGRGLRIVDALATRWGVTPTTEGKAVWFEMQLAQHDGHRRQSSAPPVSG